MRNEAGLRKSLFRVGAPVFVALAIVAGGAYGELIFGDGFESGNVLGWSSATEICDDGVDDDGDGLVDCLDADCSASPTCAPVSPEDCSSPGDEDDDGAADCDDADCVTTFGPADSAQCTGQSPICVALCAIAPEPDPCELDCLFGQGLGGDFESACADGLDNDQDSDVDCDDVDCALSAPSCSP